MNSSLDYVKKIAEDIKSLKIQGATAVAISALNALKLFVEKSPEKNFLQDLNSAIKFLINSRPTEPAMQNGIRFIKYHLNQAREENKTISGIKETIKQASESYINMLEEATKKVVKFGWKRIPDDGVIMTHCHSSVVVNILKAAKDNGKKFIVVNTETRPLYQGRKTARRLAEYGIKVYHVVDSGMRWIARKLKPDMALIGSDAISSTGVIINKIGSKLLALVANEFDFPFYVASTLLKFDASTLFGEYIPIEMRDVKEVWPDAPEGVTILNPAFETVDPKYIDGIITESGVIPPEHVLESFMDTYPNIWQGIYQEIMKIRKEL